MIILGKTNDDKGTQLEVLTQAILRKLGYQNIVCNLIGAGAEELDVHAEFQVPVPGGSTTSKIICECKAYKSPVALPEWLKFLGKLYTAEATEGGSVYGCFVALSGVNGAVTGNYNGLRQHRSHVTLLAGDKLLEEARSIHPFATLDGVSNKVTRMTPRKTKAKEVAYYAGRVYWLIAFDHDAYTVLNENGDCLIDEDMKLIGDMTDELLSWGTRIDLQVEEKARQRAELLMKIILATLIRVDGATKRKSIDGKGEHLDEYAFTFEEIDKAIEQLIGMGFLEYNAQYDLLIIKNLEEDGSLVKFGKFYQFLLRNTVPIPAIGLPFYDANIDSRLLAEVCEIQAGLILTEEQANRALHLLRLSPHALVAALTPMEMIVNHRTPFSLSPEMDAADVDIFFDALHSGLRYDFNRPMLAEYFHERRKLVELEVNTSIHLKSYKQLEFEDKLKTRTVIGQLAESMVGDRVVFAQLWAFSSKPEPWEEVNNSPVDPTE